MSTIVDQLADQMFQKPSGPAATQPAVAAPPQRTIVDDILDQDRQFVHKWQTDYNRIYERARKINPTYGFNPRPDILGPMDVEDPYTYAEAARQMETDPAEVEKARAQLLQEAIKQRGQEVIDDLRQFMPALEGESEYDYNQRLQRIYSQRLYDEGIRPILLNQPAKMERGLVGGVMAGMARGWTGMAEDILGGGTGLIATARAGIYGDDDAGVQALRRAEDNFHDYYGRRGREAHVLRPSDSVAEGGGFQPLNWRWWTESLGEQSPNFVTLMAGGGAAAQILKEAGYGAKAIKAISMMQTFGTAAALEAGSAYNQVRSDLIQKGFDKNDASTVAALEGVSIGIVNGLIELLPFDEFILKDKKTMGKLMRAARGFVIEGSTESVQEMWNVVVGAIGHDDPITREKFMQVLGAGAIGGIMGAGTDVVSPHGVGEGEQQKRPLMVFDEKSGYFWKLDPKTGGYTPFDPKSGRYYDFSKAGTMQPVTPTAPPAPPAWTPPGKGFLTIGDVAGTNRYEGSGAPAPTFGEQTALPGMEQEAKLTEWYDTTARLLVQYQIQPGATEQDMARQLQANKDLLHSLRLDILKDMQAGVQPDGTLAALTDRYLPELGVPEAIGVRLIQGIYDETAATRAKAPATPDVPPAAPPVFGEQTAIPGLEAEAKLTGWYDRTAQRLARYHIDASTTPEQIDRHVQGYSWLLGESRNMMRQAVEQGMSREQATDAAFNALREVWPEQSWELFNQTIGEVYDQVAQQVKPAAPTPTAPPPETTKPPQVTKPKAPRTAVTPPTQEAAKAAALNEEEENLAGFVEAMGNDLERGALLDELRSSFGHLKLSDQTLNQIADQPSRVRDILAQTKSAPALVAPTPTRKAPRTPQQGPATPEQPTAPAAPPAPKTATPPRETTKTTTAQPDEGAGSAPPNTTPTTEQPAGGRGIDLGISDADFNNIADEIGAELDKLEGGAGDEAQAMPEKARITGKLWQLAKKAGLYHLGKTQDFKGWAKALNQTLRGHLTNDQLVTIWNGMRFLPVVRQQVGSLPQVSADTLTDEGASDGGTDSSQSEQAGTRGSGTLEEAPAEDGPEAPKGGAADRGGERGVPGGTGRGVGDDAGDGNEHTRSADGTRAGVPVPPAGETGDVDVAQGVGDAHSGSLTDFHFEADESVGDKLIGEGGIETKFRDNLAALKLVQQLEQQNRLATEDEKKVLARYTGWGWGKQIFDRYGKHQERYQQLRQLIDDGVITEEEWYAARQSSLNAHYTSPPVIAGMWQAVEAMGFKGGNVIEAGFGIGHFKGMMPRPLKAVSYYHGIERDKLTWRIARQLYQRGSVVNEDFVESRRIPGFYRLAIGNVPFGEETIREKDAKTGLDVYPVKPNLHDFFILKMLDQLEPGGVRQVRRRGATGRHAVRLHAARLHLAHAAGAGAVVVAQGQPGLGRA